MSDELESKVPFQGFSGIGKREGEGKKREGKNLKI